MKYLDDTGLSLLWSKMKGLIPSSLPANGGNADTVDGKHYSDILCGSVKSAKMYVDNDTHIAKLGYFDLSKGEYSSTALMVGNGFWGNQHNCCELIIIGSDLYGVDDDGVAKFTISKIHLGGSYERTLYYKVNGKKVEIYVACYGGNGYGKWYSKVIGSNESNLWYADFVENCSSADLTEIGYAGVFGSATKLANARTIAIGNTGKFFDGSGDVSWSLSEIGALPLTGGTLTGELTTTSIKPSVANTYSLGTKALHYTTVYARNICGENGSSADISHQIALGYYCHDRIDFDEWGGAFYFNKTSTGARVEIASILSTGATFTMPMSIGTTSGNLNNAIKFGTGNAKISYYGNQVIFNTADALRFGHTDWDWDKWAGLRYDADNKIINLGLADGSTFQANNAQSGGTLNLVAVDTLKTSTDKLTVSAATTLSSTLNVTGATTLASTLSVTGATTLQTVYTGTTYIRGTAVCNQTLTVSGAVNTGSTLYIAGATTVGGSLTIKGGVGSFYKGIVVVHKVTSGDTTTTYSVMRAISEGVYTYRLLYATEGLNVTGSTGLGVDCDSAYRLKVSGDTYMDGKLTVTGDVALNSTLKVTGDTTLAANLSVGGTIKADTITPNSTSAIYIGDPDNGDALYMVEDMAGWNGSKMTWQLSTDGNLSNLASVSATSATIGTLTLTSGLKIQASSTKTYTFNMAKAISLGLIS